MRISSKTLQLQWLAAYQRQQARVASIQGQIGTGKRVNTAADDPAGAAQVVRLQATQGRIDNYAGNAETARRRLTVEESTLDQVNSNLDRLRELAVQANSGVQDQSNRDAIASEARSILDNLVELANTQDGEGRFLFAGNAVKTQPFVWQSGSVAYQGDSGGRSQQIGDQRQVQEGDAGDYVFGAIRAGNGTFSISAAAGNTGTGFWKSARVTDASAWTPGTYTVSFTAPDAWQVTDASATVVASGSYAPGTTISFGGAAVEIDGQPATGDSFAVQPSANQSIFATVQQFIAGLSASTGTPATEAQFQNRINGALLDLDQAQERISMVRSQVGTRLNAIDQQLDSNSELSNQVAQTISTVRDLDYATAVSDLEREMTSLQAAQQTFVKTRTSSLFDIL